MRNFNLAKALGLITFLCLLLTSCKNFEDFNEIDEVETNGAYAVPLINSTSNMQDILDEVGDQNDLSGLIIDPDGSMKVAYENEPVSQNVSDFFEDIPSFPLVIPFNSNEVPFDFMEGISIQQMDLKSGTLSFEMESQHPEDIDVLITIPNLTKDGTAFSIMTQMSYTGSSPVYAATGTISLEGYSLNVNDGMIEVYYQAINNNGDNLQINPITGMAENWQYDYIQGVWEKDTIQLSNDTLEIDIFDNWVDGEITFANPILDITLNNSFGFTTMATIDQLKVITTDGSVIYLESDVFNEPIQMNYPSVNEPGVTKQTMIRLDNTNSNIAEVLNAHPKQIIYSLSTIINPSEDPNTFGFMTDESAMGISLATELPIYGTARDFEIEEPLDSDLSELEDVDWVELKVITNNGLPVDLGIQLYFTNDAGQKIDSLYSDYENITESAVINSAGDVTSSTEKVTYIEISKERMENIKQSKNLLIGATFSTANDGSTPVKILTTHELNIKVGMKIGLE